MKTERGNVALTILGAVGAIVLIVAVLIGGYQLGWWLKGNAVNRNAKINRTSYEVQQTYREKVLDDMSKVRDLDRQIADPAYAATVVQNRAALVAQIRVTCDHIARLTTSGAGTDPDIETFHAKECE